MGSMGEEFDLQDDNSTSTNSTGSSHRMRRSADDYESEYKNEYEGDYDNRPKYDMIAGTDTIKDTIAITATILTVNTPTANLIITPEAGLTTITLMTNAFTTFWPISTQPVFATIIESGYTKSFVI